MCVVYVFEYRCVRTHVEDGRMASLAANKLWQSRHHCQLVLRLQMCLDAFNF